MSPLLAIVWKDIVIEWRNKESVSAMLMFGLLVVVIFSFAVQLRGSDADAVAAGILWVAYSFAGILGLNRSLSMEADNECLQGLLLAPIDRGSLYIGKVVSNFAFTLIAELIVLPMFMVFYHLAVDVKILWIVGITLLGTLGFVSIGTILSMISAQTRMKEVMLPILQIPTTVPVVISAVEATRMALDGDMAGISFHLELLGVFSIVYLTVAYLVFGYVVED